MSLHTRLHGAAGARLAAAALLLAACDAIPTETRPIAPDAPLAAKKPKPTKTPTVKRVTVTYVSGAVDTATWTIVAGGSAQFKATAYDSVGNVIATVTPTFRSTSAAALPVDSTSGLAKAAAAGSAVVNAVMGGVTGASRTITVKTVTQEPVIPDPEPPQSPTSIPVSISRFDGSSGAATVSTGIPLVPGALRPGQENTVRVFVGGVEQPAYVAGLAAVHTDGSLRAVLVQFRVASLASTQSLAGTIGLGTTRSAGMTLTAPIVTPGVRPANTPAGLPQAAALPTSPSYLVSTDLVGATTTAAANSALGGVYARYETDFAKYADNFWTTEGADYLLSNYYDRVLIYYAMWARTGSPAYWARAAQIAYDYRTRYVEANAYGVSPHWSLLEGLEKHYLLTGDEASRLAVGRTASRLYAAHINTEYLDRRNGESRIAARVLHSQLLAWRLTPNGTSINGVTQATYAAQLDAVYGRIAAWQQADGSFPADGQVCGGQLNYMIGLQNDALVKIYEQYLPTSVARATLQTQIKAIVQKSVDYLWRTQWLAANNAFKYASVDCTGIGAPTPAPDVNNLISAGFAWVYRTTGNTTYQAQANTIFAGGVTQAFLSGTKQFNESYSSSFRYLGYR